MPRLQRSSAARSRASPSTCCRWSRCRPARICSVIPRVILTPHAAFYSVEAERELRRKAAQNIVTWIRTGRPDYVVVAGSRKP